MGFPFSIEIFLSTTPSLMSLSQESLGFLAPDPRAGHGRRRGDGSQTSQDSAAPLPCGAGGLPDDPSSDAGRGDGSRMFTGAGGDGGDGGLFSGGF